MTERSRERMGSGGLRGLQIPWSGASGVRGGFDSHAFPPLFALALCGLLSVPSAHAQAAADTVAHPPDIQVVNSGEVKAAKRAHADSLKRQGWSAQPRVVMLRSLLLPGWGQMYNGAWYKAGAVAAGEVWMGARIYDDTQALHDLQDQIDQARLDGDPDRETALVNEYNARLDQRIANSWLLGAVLVYAMVDAYVDAHFRGFEVEFKHDPALPNGPPPDTPSGGGSGSLRLGLRWRF
jgi:hypothetical protein